MKKCALLTMDNLEGYDCFDSLLRKPLADLGWQAEDISWRDNQVDWNQYQAVIIRSPWDYQNDCEHFLSVLNDIENSKAVLMNDIDLVRWNINKNYLAELGHNGITLVPTLWKTELDDHSLMQAFEHFNAEKIIVKPCISAGAQDTFLLNKEQAIEKNQQLEALFENREFMIQPFMQNIVDEGEYSIFFFNNEFSHCILKRPKNNDFRVQEEFGGRLTKVEPENELLRVARAVLIKLPSQPMYARLDFVRTNDTFAIMEAELIEPSLYFNLDNTAAERFSKAFVAFMKTR